MNGITEQRVEEISQRVARAVMDEYRLVVAEASAKRAIEIMAAEVGTSVVRKLGWFLGLGILGLLGWLGVHGAISP